MVPDINLLPKLEKNQSNSKVLYILLGVIVLLIMSYLVWQYFSIRSQIISLTAEESTLITQRDAIQAEINTAVSTNQGSLEQSVEFVELISYPVSTLIDETQKYQPINSYLRNYSFDATSVSLTMDFETLNDLSEYISKLSNSPYFIDVQVSSVTNFELGTESVSETEVATNFDEVPRQSAEIVLLIDSQSLAIGGAQ